MTHRSLALTLLALITLLSSCDTGRSDVKHPTIAEQDQMDVQWGLTPRQTKGGAKRLMPTVENMNLPPNQPVSAPATMAPQTLPSATAPAPAASSTVDPSVINNLR